MTKKETLDRGEGKTVESPTGEQALQNHADKLANEVSALGVEDENASKVAQQIREAASSGDRGFLSRLAHDYKMVAPFIAALIAFVPWFKEQRVEANEDGHLTQVKSGEEKLSYDAKDIARLTG